MSSITRTKPDWLVIVSEMLVGGLVLFELASLAFRMQGFVISPAAAWVGLIILGLLAISALVPAVKRFVRRMLSPSPPAWILRVKRTGIQTIATASLAGATLAFFVFRIYLGHVSSRLTGNDAVMILLADPLWRVEAAVCLQIGNPGTISFVNGLAVSLWGGLSLVGLALMVACARRAAR